MPRKEEIRVDHLNPPISHYTDATRFGDLLFISGCGPLDSEGKLVGGDDVAAQARATLENHRGDPRRSRRHLRRRAQGHRLPHRHR